MTKLDSDCRTPACNSTYPKGGVSCSKDSFVVNQTFVFQIKFCGKSTALRVAAKHQALKKHLPSFILSNSTIFKTNFCFLFAF
jgi:hypothetical protein